MCNELRVVSFQYQVLSIAKSFCRELNAKERCFTWLCILHGRIGNAVDVSQDPHSKGPVRGRPSAWRISDIDFWRMPILESLFERHAIGEIWWNEPTAHFHLFRTRPAVRVVLFFPGANTCHSAPNVNSCGKVFLARLEAVSRQKPSATFALWYLLVILEDNHLYCLCHTHVRRLFSNCFQQELGTSIGLWRKQS